MPVVGDEARSGGERSVFREIQGASEVARELAAVLGKDMEKDGAGGETEDKVSAEDALARLLHSSTTAPFAEFSTSRVKFELDGASIDVDAASFGHMVVEVEVMCADASHVVEAETVIADVAMKLGLTPLVDSVSLDTCLTLRLPDTCLLCVPMFDLRNGCVDDTVECVSMLAVRCALHPGWEARDLYSTELSQSPESSRGQGIP